VTEDFVSPEHLVQSFHLTQELRLLKEEINYDDKLQVRSVQRRSKVVLGFFFFFFFFFGFVIG
jgi:hypothetical protein